MISGLCYLFPTVSRWDRIKAAIFNDLLMHKEQVGVVICKCKIELDFLLNDLIAQKEKKPWRCLFAH